MSSVNKVILVGYLGRDPDTRYAASGDAITNATLATSQQWTDKNTHEKKEATEWHRLVFYRKLAEVAGQYLKKGSLVYVEGKLQTRKWEDKDGVTKYSTEITVDSMQMLGKAPEGQDKSQERAKPKEQAAKQQSQSFADMDDDIPF